jgi:amidohydrolase
MSADASGNRSLRPQVDDVFDTMVDLRRDLHAHPELAFVEHRTSSVLRDHLGRLGLEARRCPTQTGAVAVLEGGRPGRTVLVRADIDALPVQERPGSFASTTEGIMHACGHDAHTAMALGVAEVLAGRAESLPGRYAFVFQPAEERVAGARAMIEGGLLDDLAPDVALGCHVAAVIPAGFVAVHDSLAMAGSQGFSVRFTGAGGHGAMNAGAGDVVQAAARLVSELGDVVSGVHYQEVDAVCSAGSIHAGTAGNVVPTEAVVEGTIRTFGDEQAAETYGRLERLAATIATDGGVEQRVERLSTTPPVVNAPEASAVVRTAARYSMPDDRILTLPPVTPSDDMSEILRRVPGCYFFVSAGRADGTSGAHHSPAFAIDEEALRNGATVLADSAVALAGQS